jgi:MFS family permease
MVAAGDEKEFTKAGIYAAIAAWIGMAIGPNSMVSASMSLFIKPLTGEFGLSRTEVSALLLISPWTNAIFSPWAGRTMDRWGLRRVLLPGALLFALASMARGFATSPWQLAAGFFVVSIASAMNSSVGYAKLVSLWFSNHRGAVLGCAIALGAGLGSAIAPQIMRIVIQDHGWRVAYFSLGAFVIILPLPALFFLIREPAKAAVAHAQIAEQALPGLTRNEAVRTKSFWLIFFAILLASMALIGTTAHAVPLLTERGFSSLIGTTVVSCFFFGGVAGQLTAGFIADRVNSQRVVLPYFASALVGAMIVHRATSTAVLLGGAVFMGLGQGAEIAFAAYLTSRYFGLRAYGSIYSIFYAASNIGIGIGLMSMGLAHDHFGSYRPMAYVFGAALLIATLCIALLGPYPFASRKALVRDMRTGRDPDVALDSVAPEAR